MRRQMVESELKNCLKREIFIIGRFFRIIELVRFAAAMRRNISVEILRIIRRDFSFREFF